MEASLVNSLQQKLDDLDRKVQVYRLERLAEFHQFYHQLLHDQPAAAVANVRRAIVPSLSTYDALRPDIDKTESRSTSMPNPAAFQPGTLPSTASPPSTELHEREQEFQGLFTPSYLPLLDSRSGPTTTSHPHVHTAATTTAPAAGDNGVPMSPGSDLTERASASTRGNGAVAGPETPGPGDDLLRDSLDSAQLPIKPPHARQSTDDTSSSSLSEKSDGKVRRSALRRSPPLTSPKRVRFDFKGLEVLPTASPQHSELPTPRPSSPASKQEQSVFASILGVDEEDDYVPPPKKVSSSEALRALSRTPLEEGTVWTVVNPDTEESSSSPQSESTFISSSTSNQPETPPKPSSASSEGIGNLRTNSSPHSCDQEATAECESDQEESSDEEEFLAMGKRKSSPKKPVIRSVPASAAASAATAPDAGKTAPDRPSEPQSTGSLDEEKDQASSDDIIDEEDDELFHFEAGGLTPPPKPRARPRPPPLQESEDDDELEDEAHGSGILKQHAPERSSSVSIARSAEPEGPPTPTSAKFQAGSLGSYKGRSVIMPVVKDPTLHAQAASLGEFHSFVGSLDGRSGMDEGDASSFRASMVSSVFSGTPRSLTERMMMEDMEAHRRARKEEP
jgi:hypothetical protein